MVGGYVLAVLYYRVGGWMGCGWIFGWLVGPDAISAAA